MSSLERLKDRILADAEAQAAAIRREAEEKVAADLERGRREGETETAAVLTKAKVEAEEVKRRILTNAQLDGRRTVLAAKGALLGEVFEAALVRLSAMEDSAYRGVLERQMVKAATGGDDEVILNERDTTRLGPEFFTRVNEALGKAGKGGSLRPAIEKRPIQGGFILRAANVEVDCSFETRVRQVREESEPDVARLLFGQQQTGTPA